MQITVLGAGLVGNAIVKDLAREKDFQVTVVDRSEEALARLEGIGAVRVLHRDLRQPGSVADAVAPSDLVVCAVPGFMGFATLQSIIEAGKNVVDISFFAEDPFLLDDLAREEGVTAVVDCGVAPGLCNILAGRLSEKLDRMERYVCYVGGLPKVRHWPFEYKAGFSPTDVLEEYTRPARFVEHGHEVVHAALSDPELRDLPGVGTLEAFNTDGLRTLRVTLNAPFMKEKTLRYPGHAQLMRIFRDSGFLGREPIEVDGEQVRPLSLTSKLLFHQWRLAEGDEDLTVMQVVIEGEVEEKRVRYTYDLLDAYDATTHTTSMARTTGYTCTIVARQVARGLFRQEGICPPEYLGRTPGCYENLLLEYSKRNIHLKERVEEIAKR
ncbi:MAG: saccharopine dehydrogenase C-terminal domain-containing protein [Planctomycetota bacterium]